MAENEKGIGFVTLLIVTFVVLAGGGIYYAYIMILKPAQQITGEVIEQIKDGEIPEMEDFPGLPSVETEISISVLEIHNTPDDCWIVYRGGIYDISDAEKYSSISKKMFEYCGEVIGVDEEKFSNEEWILNFGELVGILVEPF